MLCLTSQRGSSSDFSGPSFRSSSSFLRGLDARVDGADKETRTYLLASRTVRMRKILLTLSCSSNGDGTAATFSQSLGTVDAALGGLAARCGDARSKNAVLGNLGTTSESFIR